VGTTWEVDDEALRQRDQPHGQECAWSYKICYLRSGVHAHHQNQILHVDCVYHISSAAELDFLGPQNEAKYLLVSRVFAFVGVGHCRFHGWRSTSHDPTWHNGCVPIDATIEPVPGQAQMRRRLCHPARRNTREAHRLASRQSLFAHTVMCLRVRCCCSHLIREVRQQWTIDALLIDYER
jgi:hypothetical protein